MNLYNMFGGEDDEEFETMENTETGLSRLLVVDDGLENLQAAVTEVARREDEELYDELNQGEGMGADNMLFGDEAQKFFATLGGIPDSVRSAADESMTMIDQELLDDIEGYHAAVGDVDVYLATSRQAAEQVLAEEFEGGAGEHALIDLNIYGDAKREEIPDSDAAYDRVRQARNKFYAEDGTRLTDLVDEGFDSMYGFKMLDAPCEPTPLGPIVAEEAEEQEVSYTFVTGEILHSRYGQALAVGMGQIDPDAYGDSLEEVLDQGYLEEDCIYDNEKVDAMLSSGIELTDEILAGEKNFSQIREQPKDNVYQRAMEPLYSE